MRIAAPLAAKLGSEWHALTVEKPTLHGEPYKLLPLISSEDTLGLLIIEPSNLHHLLIPEQRRRLERVLANLLENALKYAGSARAIGIRACVLPKKIRIEVWDYGPGITSGSAQHIFKKFTRGNEESSFPGIGRGLAICRAIVMLQLGEISAANRPEGRSLFYGTTPSVASAGNAGIILIYSTYFKMPLTYPEEGSSSKPLARSYRAS